MSAVITALLLALLSAGMILLMCRLTNKEILKGSSSSTTEETETSDEAETESKTEATSETDPEEETDNKDDADTESETDPEDETENKDDTDTVSKPKKADADTKEKQTAGDPAEAISAVPYAFEIKTIVVGAVLLILSGLAGYRIFMTANSPVALVELCAAYLTVLGAAVIDYKLHIIPNYFPIALFAVRILCLIYEFIFTDQALEYLISSILGCFLCFVLLMIAGKLSKGGIGKGDVKLLAALGFTCGLLKVFTSLLISLVICLIVSLLLIWLKKKTFKDHMSFGPFIYLGFLLVIIFSLS